MAWKYHANRSGGQWMGAWGRTRRFDGKVYHSRYAFTLKSDATYAAKEEREDNRLSCRVTTDGAKPFRYVLWMRGPGIK